MYTYLGLTMKVVCVDTELKTIFKISKETERCNLQTRNIFINVHIVFILEETSTILLELFQHQPSNKSSYF